MPWTAKPPTYGFSPLGTLKPWLPQPSTWAQYSVAAEEADPRSMLSLYRAALRLRPQAQGPLRWLDDDPDVLAFRRGDAFSCVINLGTEPVAIPDGTEVLLASDELAERALPADTAVWLRSEPPPTRTEVETAS
jgi:alpha-glucosidase